MKYIFFILLLISGTCYGQTKYYIRADTTQLEKVGGNNELNLLNSTRSRTGAYLKNTLNGRTGFFYAVDSAYISGTNLVLVRGGGSQNVTVPIGGTGVGWDILGNAGTTAGTNFLGTTDSIGLMFKANNQRSGFIDVNNQSVSLGMRSLRANTTGSLNTAIGYESMMANTTAGSHTAVGWRTLNKNTTGQDNTAIGIAALRDNTTGSRNTAVGSGALFTNITGTDNTAVGQNALSLNTASSNTAVGREALEANTSGSLNTAVGAFSQTASSTAGLNTSVGYQSLRDNSGGTANAAFGNNALLVNTTGFKNTAIGAGALEANTTGFENTFVGEDAGLNGTTGSVNVGMGWNAKSGKKGIGNVVLGTTAGATLGDTSSLNTFVGYQAGFNVSQEDTIYNSIAIGANSYTTASNQLSIADAVTRFTFPGVSRGVADYVLTDSLGNGQYWVARPTSTVASSVPINGLTAATAGNSISNGSFQQNWNWNTFDGAGNGLGLAANTTATTGDGGLFFVNVSGTNAASSIVSTAVEIQNQHFGTSSTNIGIRVSAANGTINNAIDIGSGALTLNGSAGTSGQVLTSAGANTLPTWSTPSGGSGLTIGTTAIASGTTTRLLFEGTSNILQEDADFTVDQTNNLINSYASSSAGKVQVGQLNTVSGYGAIYFGQTPSATNYAIAGTTTELLINSGFGDIKYMYGTLLVGKQIDTRWGIGYNVAPLTGTELTVTTGDATFRALVLKAVGSQSENIMEVRDNSDAILSRVGPTGEIRHSTLAGSGSRAVLADAEGDLSAPVSDERLKIGLKPISKSVDVIAMLKDANVRGVFYDWKDTKRFGTGRDIGFTAQMFENIPGMTGTMNATGEMYLNYEKITALLWEQNRLLLSRIEALEKKIKNIKRK